MNLGLRFVNKKTLPVYKLLEQIVAALNSISMQKTFFFLLFVAITFVTNAQLQPRLVLPVGHTDLVRSASFSADGKYVVTVSDDNTARIWEASSGKEVRLLHMERVRSASFSSDGKYLVSASGDSTARIWEVSSGKEIHVLKGHRSYVYSASFSADGKYVVTSSVDSTVRIWEVSSGNEVHVLLGHTDGVRSASFSVDGKYVVTASDDNTARIWDVQTGLEFKRLEGHTSSLFSAKFSADGKKVVTASWDNTARIWEVQTGKQLHSLQGHTDGVRSALFSADGKYVATASNDSTARIWEVSSGKEIHKLQGHESYVYSASFNLDGKYIVTASNDNTARIWDIQTGLEFHLLQGHTSSVFSAEFSADGKYVVTASRDNTARIWDVQTGKDLHSLHGYTRAVYSSEFSSNGKYVVNISGDTTAKIWDVYNGKEVHSFHGHSDKVRSSSFNADGKYVITASDDSTARIWDVQSDKELLSLIGHTSWVNSASFSADGNYVVTASEDDTTRIWDAKNGKLLHRLLRQKWLNSAEFSSDGKYIVSASGDNTARIWDVKTARELFVLQGHNSSVKSASFSSDSKYVVTASEDNTARIWDAKTGKELHILTGHLSWLKSASFSQDGKFVVTASNDNTARIWDVQTGQQLRTLLGHTSLVNSAKFSSDGKYIITTGSGHRTIIWNASTGKQLYIRLQLKNNDWLIYDNDNHFDGSEGAINYLYLTCGLEIIDLTQVKDSLWIPGLAGKILRGERLLINDKEAPRLSDLNICDLTPIVEELPRDSKDNLLFQIKPRNGGLGETEVYINSNLTYKYLPEQLTKTKNNQGKLVYLLSLSKDSIDPFLSGGKGSVNPVLVKCKIKGASIYSRGAEVEVVAENDSDLPRFYGVFVGVNDYNNLQKENSEFLYKNLDYAAKDAGDLANVVENSAHALFKDSAFIYRLTGKSEIEPTKENLKKVLAEIGAKAKANDILYIFFAGHGDIIKTDQHKSEIRFILQGADKLNKNTGGFGVEELTAWCHPQKIKAQKRVFVFDACHSGQFVNETYAVLQGGVRGDAEDIRIRQLASLKDKNGMMILAASSDNESAYEDPSLNQGVLTYHLLQAVKEGKDSILQINKWFESTLGLVKDYTVSNNRNQTPETFGNGRFEIGYVNNAVKDHINIDQPKPKVGISVFIDPTGDAEKKYPSLEKMVNDHFKQSGSRGAFISTGSNEKAYYAKGSIFLEKDKLKVRYTLYYGDLPIAKPMNMPVMKVLSEEELVSKVIKALEASINGYIKNSKK